MSNNFYILDNLTNTIYLGFSTWTLIWALGKSFRWKFYFELDYIDSIAFKTLIFSELVYSIVILLKLENTERLFGSNWFGFWIYPITFILLPQLFWFINARRSKALRVILAIWTLIILHLNKFIIFITSLHREYSSISLKDFLTEIILIWLFNFGIFTLILILLAIIGKKLTEKDTAK